MSRQTTASSPRRVLLSLAATALVGAGLPLAAAPAGAVAGAVEGDPPFAGYAATTTATPVRIEMRAVSLGSPPSGYRLTLSAKSRMAATTLGEGG